jgi:hypothetical protein
MQPSGSGATGKGMGPAAEACWAARAAGASHIGASNEPAPPPGGTGALGHHWNGAAV